MIKTSHVAYPGTLEAPPLTLRCPIVLARMVPSHRPLKDLGLRKRRTEPLILLRLLLVSPEKAHTLL